MYSVNFSATVFGKRHNGSIKVNVLDFEGKFLHCPKCGNWVIFGSEINTFQLFSKSFYQVFLTLYL